MSLPNELLPVGLLGTGAAGGYQIERSLRFNSSDSAYLSRTPTSSGNRKTWTWSGWVKRSGLGSASAFFGCDAGGGTSFPIGFTSGDQFWCVQGATTYRISTARFRDTSAWYHFVVAFDTTQVTADNRIRAYVNGAEITAFATLNNPAQNFDTPVNSGVVHSIGSDHTNTAARFFTNGYLADIHFIDGQALDPTSFGEFDDNGVWQPIEYTGTYGTNGFHLPFSDNSTAAALGTDTSGNSNTWTVNNISVAAGAGNDSLVDTPTSYGTDTGAGGEVRGNYATLNPLGTAGAIPTNGNLSVSSSSTVGNRISTFFLTTGKWYWEGSGTGYVGTVIGRDGASYTASVSASGSNAIGWWPLGPVYWDGGNNGGSTTYTSSDIIGVALDMDSGNVKFYKNGSLVYTITFGSGTVPDLSSGVFPGYNVGTSTQSVDFNFGQRPFAYTAPSGYKALCTTNLPDPTIADGSTVMDVKLYTGNGSSQEIFLSFTPDLVWIKSRSSATNHALYDILRNDGNSRLESNTTAAEVNDSALTFATDLFKVYTSSQINANSQTYAAWAWDAGSSTVTNTDGSITSQVRANASAGFSIVTYTGNGLTNQTVGHGLNVKPSLVIYKDRDSASEWRVIPTFINDGYYLALNSTAAIYTASTSYFGTNTSSVLGISGSNSGIINANNNDIIAYCFAPIEGYSAFGSYTGNGSADGPFVYTGFRPRWVLIKASSSVSYGNWVLHDTSRSTYNVSDKNLYANLSNSEDSTYLIDCLSNGFKLRSASFDGTNGSGSTYIYAAFAENPFSLARAR